jgi:hypothetical protein
VSTRNYVTSEGGCVQLLCRLNANGLAINRRFTT